MKLSPRQIAAVLALKGPERYEHFIKQVADHQQVWGLYSDGWAMAATDSNAAVLPFWPASEYATACAVGEWAGYEPRSMSVEEFYELLDNLEDDEVLPGVFYTPSDKGVVPSHDQLREDLLAELERYE
jgi:Protein of unknown function (DUF2750)